MGSEGLPFMVCAMAIWWCFYSRTGAMTRIRSLICIRQTCRHRTATRSVPVVARGPRQPGDGACGKHGSAEWLPGKGSVSVRPVAPISPLVRCCISTPSSSTTQEVPRPNAGAMRWCWITSPHPWAEPVARRPSELEGLLDELVEARQLGGERTQVLETQVLSTLQDLDWPGIPSRRAEEERTDLTAVLTRRNLSCELKESQIRTGLHRYGQCPDDAAMTELLMALARPPLQGQPGLTQLMAREAGLEFDPWSQDDGESLDPADRARLAALGCQRCRRVGDGSAWLEQQALLILRQLVLHEQAVGLATPRSLVETSAHLRHAAWSCGSACRVVAMQNVRG